MHNTVHSTSLTIEAIKAAICWCIFLLVESYMPLADHVCGVARISEFISNCWDFERHTIWLGGTNHAVL